VQLPEEELEIWGNEPQLDRAFGNIFSNGLRYAKTTLRAEVFRERKWIRVEISDDGDGIPPEDLPHIFDRFYKGTGGQHGIGLAITQEIIALHRGKIRAYSQDGAQFCVWLRRKT
jgi:signal transduction histidine kinase